eukprot:CAMPEP_0172318850 /NCGR_PEP_ID=MMETSP1058-20130122/36021_1 /TAXON_ID=83371 /ORGANISM="Detonula confervacea, Strain CCMP 353" /LENGTH=831 /DNA_ID=CAMNT_0013033769 /DNA_START=163 /DNA_END=2655 /DNA_ORIENTATION=-
MATLSWSLWIASSALLTVRIEAFSSPMERRGASKPSVASIAIVSSSRKLKGITRISPRYASATTSNVASLKPSASSAAKASQSQGNKKNKQSKRRKSKYNKQKKNKQKKNKQNTSSSSRPYTDLSIDELKKLTEFHLSKNIHPDGTISLGDMSSGQMHEFSRLLSSWSKFNTNVRQRKVLAAEMAEQCLRELIEEKKAGNVNAVKMITPDMYYLVIKAWLKVGSYNDLVHANSLLDLMERVHPQNDEDDHSERFVSSSMKCYAAVLDAWCKSRSMGAEAKAEELLNRMASAGRRNSFASDVRDVRHYNNVMNRIATNGKSNAGGQAERLLDDLIASYKSRGESSGDDSTTASASAVLAPNRSSFNTVIKAYAKAGGANAATNAKRILNMMENPGSLGLQNLALQIMPDKISYTSVLMAWANTRGDSSAGEKAEELLGQMQEMYEGGNGDVKPDTVTYNAVLKVWGKCGHSDAGERSEEILNKMLQLYEAGDPDVIPDDFTFNSVIHNIANSNVVDSHKRAIRLLEQMEQSCETGLIKARPDIISYNSVLNAFAKNGGPESAQHAEEMLDSLENDSGVWNIRPDVYSYNIVISAWGNCGDANKAVALLDRMTSRTNEGKADLKPDVTTYNSILHAWSQSSDRNAPVKALGLLEIMLRLHEGGDRSANPDVLSFTTVINAFSKSNYPRKARQTRELLRRMKQLYDDGQKNMQPNIYVYAAVLNACAYTFGRSEQKEDALKIGIETYEELQSSGIKVNHVAYGSFIRVCRRLMTDDSLKNHFITRAFGQCCSDGQLGEYVVRQLRPIPELYVSLLQAYIIDNDEVSYQDLPSSW